MKTNLSFLQKSKAFTLIEVLISIAIFMIIFTLSIVNYRQGSNANIFRLQSFDIEDAIRSIQNMALTGQKINNQIPDNYGLNFTLDSGDYIIFGDENDSYTYDAGDSIYASGTLHENIEFNEAQITCQSEGDPNIYDIVFIPPQPEMIVNADLANGLCNLAIISDNVSGRWDIWFDTASQRVWTDFIE